MPEAALAREAEICFGGISVVTNHAAGITEKKMKAKDVVEVMSAMTIKLKELLKEIFYAIPFERKCSCKNTLNEASV
jgi:5'-methylthioadenosine phosphorylase